MNSTFNYIIEANLCLLIFGLFYYLLLKNDTHFRFIRYYLIGSALLTLTIPLLHFSNPFAGNEAVPLVNELQAITLPELVIGTEEATAAVKEGITWPWPMVVMILYVSVTFIFLTLFFYQVYQILRFRRLKRKAIYRKNDHVVIPTDGQLPTFSFFNMLFFDNSVELQTQDKQKIIDHELVHIREWHSLDTLVLELTKILFWINPVAWWMRKNMRDVHEYLADQQVLKNTNQEQYSSLLAKMALKHLPLPLGHHFNRSLTLKRIKMMKSPKTKLKFWKWATMVPLVMIVAFVLSCNDEVMKEVDEVMETTTQMEIPESLHPVLKELQEKHPDADFFYLETDGSNREQLLKLQKRFGPNSIAYLKTWKERKMLGAIVNKNGPLKNVSDTDGEVSQIVEDPAVPFGGYESFYKKLADTLQYPAQAREAGIEGKVYVQFVVDIDGTLTDITAVKGIGGGCDEAALAAMAAVGPFKPAFNNGVAVKQRIILPITFVLDRQNIGEPLAKYKITVKDKMQIETRREGLVAYGTITNPQGEPIAGASIIIRGTNRGTISDKDGHFNLRLFKEDDEILFSHRSYENKRLPLKDIK